MRLTQQRQDVLSRLVSLRQHGGTRLLQDVRAAHVGHFGRVVSILNTGLGSGQVVNGAVQVVDYRIETVLYRTQGGAQLVNLGQGFVEGSQRIGSFRRGAHFSAFGHFTGTPTLMLSLAEQETASTQPLVRQCPKWDGKPLTFDVGQTFAEGSQVRDFYSGNLATVKAGKITLRPAEGSNGLLLLEKADSAASAPFNWHNATIYFVLTDRFVNGNPTNDNSYGRHKDGMQEIGTFHGGDLQGLTSKLDYLQQLGVNALWISSPLEQIHGWVGGGAKGDFPHYAYHGYYTQDWTRLDANMGDEADLRQLVDEAHRRGMRVLFDIVMNHTGYATLADMQEFHFGSLYLKGDELKKTLGERWTDWKPRAAWVLRKSCFICWAS